MHLEIYNSFDLLSQLKSKNLLLASSDKLWWPNSGSFEVILGVILTQNTKWINVEYSLNQLKMHDLISLESIINCNLLFLESLIKKSGFFRQKAARLKLLCKNIINYFNNFNYFRDNVSREWLLEQKGIGKESADSILNYACYRDVMVVDKYTQKLLNKCGFEFDNYDDIQQWLQNGIMNNYDMVEKIYGYKIQPYEVYARFHGKIVEYCK